MPVGMQSPGKFVVVGKTPAPGMWMPHPVVCDR